MTNRIEMQEVEEIARDIIGCDFTASVYIGDTTLYLLESFDLFDEPFCFTVPAFSSRETVENICKDRAVQVHECE